MLLIALVAVVLGMFGANTVGGGGAFMLGWFAVILGAAVAGALTAFITTDATAYNGLRTAADASVYGLFTGWIVGITAASTRRSAATA